MNEPTSLLLIDDNPFDADLLRHILDAIPNFDLRFEWVNGFQAGLETVCENRHDICLVDHNLGPQNGADLIRQALQRGCRKPLILYSGKEDIGLGVKAISWGAVDYIVKDHIEPFMLEKTLRNILERDRILQESARMQAKMYDAQRLESLGLMASGIAHDFNNILGIIFANSELAMGVTDETSAAHRYLNSICLATERAAELTNQMLAYSGRGRFRLSTLDLRSLTLDTLDFCRVGIPRRVELACHMPLRPPPIHGDATQIRQVLMNLIQNAADSINGEGAVHIDCRVTNSPETWNDACHFVTPLAEGRYVVLKISDNGCGMNQDQLGRIFDPFFTTKTTGRGLGLAAVLGIVKAHKGSLRVHSQAGVGTTFEVWIPVFSDHWDPTGDEEPPSHLDQPHLAANPSNSNDSISNITKAGKTFQSGYVLVVDDEPAILQALEAMLQGRGYQTLLADNADKAIAILENNEPIRAAVLDVMLTGRSGVELFRDLREKIPDLPVVFISGYNESEVLLPLMRSGDAQYLMKPFSSTKLIEALGAAIHFNQAKKV